jgi:hypothetical protein
MPVGDPSWHPLFAKIGTNFANKRRSLCRYSSLAGLGDGVWFFSHHNRIKNIKILKVFGTVMKSQTGRIARQPEAMWANQSTQCRYLLLPYQHVSEWRVTDTEGGKAVRDEDPVSSQFELFCRRIYLEISVYIWPYLCSTETSHWIKHTSICIWTRLVSGRRTQR